MDGFEVPIADSHERWSELTLEDGTVIRVKTVVASVARIEGQWDAEGNPLYAVKSSPAMAIISVPDNLKKPDEKIH
jgi:hypothetical protein